LTKTTPWLGTEAAVYESVNFPRSVWLQRSRTLAEPAGNPMSVQRAVIEAAEPPRLKSATATVFVPDSFLAQTW